VVVVVGVVDVDIVVVGVDLVVIVRVVVDFGVDVVVVVLPGAGLDSFLFTVNPAFKASFPDGPATPTNLEPTSEWGPMVILAVIAVSLVAVKLFTLIPRPKDTPVAPVKSAPLIVTSSVAP
jgi:hypothetical protein